MAIDCANLGGLGFSEYTGNINQGATKESFDLLNGTLSAVREFIGPWANRFDFIDSYLLVEQNEYPDRRVAKISKIDIKGEGTSTHNTVTNMAQFDRAHLVVNYDTIIGKPLGQRSDQAPEDFSNRRFIEESIESNVEVLQIEGSQWKISDPDSAFDQERIGEDFKKIGIIVPLQTVTITIPHVFKPYWAESILLSGKLNNTAWITPSGIVIGKGQIRYDGIVGSTKIDTNTLKGESDYPFPVWSITHQLSVNINGWNNKYYKGEFLNIINSTTLENLYETTDLYQIFFGFGSGFFDKGTLDSINTLYNDLVTLLKQSSTLPSNSVTKAMQNKKEKMLKLVRKLGFNV